MTTTPTTPPAIPATRIFEGDDESSSGEDVPDMIVETAVLDLQLIT